MPLHQWWQPHRWFRERVQADAFSWFPVVFFVSLLLIGFLLWVFYEM